MRTLKEEIAYCQKEGFHRDTIELSVMLFWLGDLVMLQEKAERLQRIVDRRNEEDAVRFVRKG